MLNLPLRYNPVRCLLSKRVCAEVPLDPVLGTPLFTPAVRPTGGGTPTGYAEPVEFLAQVNRDGMAAERIRRRWGGNEPDAAGRFVVKVAEPANAGVVFAAGDLVVGIADEAGEWEVVEYVIVDVRRQSYLRGGPLLVYLDFLQRREGRETV